MSDIALILNNTQLDLDVDEAVPLNFQASIAEDISEILTSFTNSFDIPLTDTNRKAFENAGEIPNQTRMPYVSVFCRLIVNGRDLFGESRLVILEFDEVKGWRVAFYAGNVKTALAGSLRDLDLSSYNFVLSTANAAARANNTTGVVYGAVNYGVDNTPKECDIRYSHFQFYIATLIGIIFNKINVPLTIKNPSGTLFNRLVLPILEPKKIQSEISGFKAVSNATQSMPDNGVFTVINYQTVVSGNLDGAYSTVTNIWTAPFPGKYKISARSVYVAGAGAGAVRGTEINIQGAGTWVGSSIYAVLNEGVIGTNTIEVSAEIEIMTLPVTVRVRFATDAVIDPDDIMQPTETSFQVESSNEVLPGNTIDVAASMPDMTQAELFKQIVTMANAIAYFQFGELTVMGFDRLQSAEMVDMTGKVDTLNPVTTLLQSNLGRITKFRYDNDQYAPSLDFGGGKVTLNNDVLEPVVDKIKLIFSACDDLPYMNLFQTIHIPAWRESRTTGASICSRAGVGVTINFSAPHNLVPGSYILIHQVNLIKFVISIVDADSVTVVGPNLPSFSNSEWTRIDYEKNSLKPRIGFALPQSTNIQVAFRAFNQAVTAAPVSKQIVFNSQTVPITAGVEGLSWEHLLKNFFPSWLGCMEEYKLVRCHMMLTDDDAYFVDFTKTWYIAKFSARFYVQRINKYVGDGNTTEVEILAIQDFIDPSKITPL